MLAYNLAHKARLAILHERCWSAGEQTLISLVDNGIAEPSSRVASQSKVAGTALLEAGICVGLRGHLEEGKDRWWCSQNRLKCE